MRQPMKTMISVGIAEQAVLFDIHDKRRRWEWKYFAKRRDQRKAYIAAFRALKSKDKVCDCCRCQHCC